jgi:hypothetical protein
MQKPKQRSPLSMEAALKVVKSLSTKLVRWKKDRVAVVGSAVETVVADLAAAVVDGVATVADAAVVVTEAIVVDVVAVVAGVKAHRAL